MRRGDRVRTVVPVNIWSEYTREVASGTDGEVKAVRHLPTDPEPLALVKFKGHAGYRSLPQRLLEVL